MGETERKAGRERRTLVFVDESGLYLLPAVVRTYAPCGQAPVLSSDMARIHLSVMGAVTSTGGLYTLVREAALTGKESGQFLQHLRRHVAERLLVIWDGASIHWATEVKSFLAKDGAKAIHLEPLPSYVPELNPVEGVWEHLKYVELRNLCCWNLPHLSTELTLAIRRLRSKPHLIRACFAGAGLSLRYGLAIYATLSRTMRQVDLDLATTVVGSWENRYAVAGGVRAVTQEYARHLTSTKRRACV